MSTQFRFNSLCREGKIAALKGLAFVLASRLVSAAYQEQRTEEYAAQNGIDGVNDLAAEREGQSMQRRTRFEQGFDETFTPAKMAEARAVIVDELDTLAQSAYDHAEAVSEIVKRQVAKSYDPASSYNVARAKALSAEAGITLEHATGKLAARHRKYNDALAKRVPEVLERIAAWEAQGSRFVDFDEFVAAQSATNQLYLIRTAGGALEREAQRLKDVDMKYDWDDMLAQAKLLEGELPKFAAAFKDLAHAGTPTQIAAAG